jgi:hypothetical protein
VLVKHWPFLESLIVEKVRRRSSAMKSDSDDSYGKQQFGGLGAGGFFSGPGLRDSRSNSYQVTDPIEELD